jgi:hypothetical protein
LLYDFENNTVGDAYTTINYYGGDVASTAIVAADPASTSTKVLKMTSTNYNQAISFSVTLPTGKLLTDYDRLYFDRYSTALQYTQVKILANTITIYADAGSNYPSQGTAATWITKDYEISATAPAENAFTLFLGYSINNDTYYIDNVKLHLKTITSVNTVNENPFIVYCADNSIKLSESASQVDVYNIEGCLLVSAKNTSVVNVSDLGHGIYIVKARINGQTFNSKVSK